ncbi:hypothetical protein MIND_00630600 [Mycena indigotica]|uniref:C2 domain-containing protein n=1 Tax=Mycena indigotica TaxID=2126181 RepID=A0A8H6SRC4_9AGAR|nr:uncharacterized protein MIND_00630600 [Mycena indigotica]KAF7303994.1 hypothetical protein MIND_00630600 [Mycena indigotica]
MASTAQTYTLQIHKALDFAWKPTHWWNNKRFYVAVAVRGAEIAGCKTHKTDKRLNWNFETNMQVVLHIITMLTFTLLRVPHLDKHEKIGVSEVTVQHLLQQAQLGKEVTLALQHEGHPAGKLVVSIKPWETSTGLHSAENLPVTKLSQSQKGKLDRILDTCKGLSGILNIMASTVPQPFNTPVEVLGVIFEILITHQENEEELKDLQAKLLKGLIDVNEQILKANKYNPIVMESSQELAWYVITI